MRSSFFHGVGGVLSADIAVPDHEREVGFYSQVLTTGSAPLWRDDLSNNEGTPIIGLGERTPEYESLPLQWMPHIQVADVGAGVAQALEGGGRELMHGKDEEGRSQWAVLVDPAGAAFGLVPVEDEATAGAQEADTEEAGTVGRIAGLTLVVPDVPAACAFYEQVVGWSAGPARADGEVEMLRPDGKASAALRPAAGDHGGLPSAWILGLPVGDLDASLRLVRESGGEVVSGSTESGRAIVRDPVGVVVALQAER